MKSNTTRPFYASNSTSQNSSGENEDYCQSDGYSEEEMNHTIAICVVNVFLCLTALFGNSTIIIAIWKTSSLHSPANMLLTSLAVSDFAVGLISHPLFIATLVRQMYDISTSSRALWVAFNIVSTFLSGASFLTVTAIGIDRLLALQLHLRYVAVVTPFRVRWLIIFIWVISGVSSSIGVRSLVLYYQVAAPVLVTLLVVNFVVYFRIYHIVRRHQVQIQQRERQQDANNGNIFSMNRFKKTAMNTFLVYILLLFCYTPQSFVAVALFKTSWRLSSKVAITTGTIVLLNSSLNPLLYCWRVREIRTAIKQYFCC